MSKTSNLLMFIVGATVGAVVANYYLKDKYSKIAEEEIESVKEVFSKKTKETDDQAASDNEVETTTKNVRLKPPITEYVSTVKKNYTQYSNTKDEVPDPVIYNDDDDDPEKPYVITPEEFGELVGYDGIGLTYYADKVLADEDDEIVENIESTVGHESLETFGQYEEDSVFVRNDRLHCDYEILLDQRNYSDVRKMMYNQCSVFPRQKQDNKKPPTKPVIERKPHEVD